MTALTGPDATRWAEAQVIAQEVIDGTRSDPTNGQGLYFGNTDTVKTRMDTCAAKIDGFVTGTISGTDFHWSNGGYTGGTVTDPTCGAPEH